MEAVPGPRAGRRSNRLLRAAAAVLASASFFAVGSVAAPTTPAVAATEGISVQVTPGDAGVLTPDGMLSVTVSIRNDSEAPVAPGDVNVYLNRSLLDSRAELAEWLAPAEEDQRRPGALVSTSPTAEIPAGSTLVLPAVAVPVDTLGLAASASSFGPRGLAARLISDNAVIAEGRGTAVWYPGDSTAQSGVTVLAPLTVPATTAGVLDSETLADLTAPGGVLTRELDSVAGRPEVVVGIDPRIILSIRALGTTAPEAATAWLERLDALPNDIFPLAYADADVALEAQAGAPQLLRPTSVEYALDASDFDAAALAEQEQEQEQEQARAEASQDGASGEEGAPEEGLQDEGALEEDALNTGVPDEGTGDGTANDAAGTDPQTSATPDPTPTTAPPTIPSLEQVLAWDYTHEAIAWPAPNTMTAGTLPVLAASGVTTTVVSSSNLAPASGATPEAAATAGDAGVLVSDAVLSDLLRTAITAGSEAQFRNALSRLSAELAVITREQPGENRTFVAALGRAVPTGPRMAETLDVLAALPWAGLESLDEALATDPTAVTVVDRPATAERVDTTAAVLAGEAQMAAFSVILERPELLTGEQRMNVLALLSVGWLDALPGWLTAANEQQAEAAEVLSSVRVGESSVLQLVSDNVPIPVRIENELDQPVTVLVSGRTTNSRAEVEGSVPVTVPARASQRASLPVRSVSNGPSTILISVTSVDGTVSLGGVAPIDVEIRAGWENIAILITGIGVFLLFGFGIVRSVRKRHRERDGATGHADTAAPVIAGERGHADE